MTPFLKVTGAANHHQLWVPAGFAHGFLTLSAQAEVLYKTTDFWSRDCECAIRWNNPQFVIGWPLEPVAGSEPLLSEKVAVAPFFTAADCFV